MDEAVGKDRRRITVSGVGHAAAVADAVLLRLGAEATAATPGNALADCAEAEQRMVAAAIEAGVPRARLTTRWATVEPQWDHYHGDRPRPRGYVARVDVEAILTDVAAAGAVASAALTAGGEAARLHALVPIVRDQAPAEATAREQAYADARAKAEQYAALAGQRVGRLLELADVADEMGHYRRGSRLMAVAASSASMEVHPGEHEISAAVSATWELAD